MAEQKATSTSLRVQNIEKINTAGLVGYILSIILLVGAIVGIVGIAICTVGAVVISIKGIDDLNTLAEDAKDSIKVNDETL